MDRLPTLDRDAVWASIDAERSSLADLLDDLGEEEWVHPSLCDGWRVRDVAAHLTLATAGVRDMAGPAGRGRGDFDRVGDGSAVRPGAAPTGGVGAAVRALGGFRPRG